MRCIGRTKTLKRCKNNCQLFFCRHHKFQPFLVLLSIGSTFIWLTDFTESAGLKKPIDYIRNSPAESSQDEPLILTAFVHGPDGRQHIVIENQGKLIIDFGDNRRTSTIGENGKTVFSEIPIQFKDQKVTIGLEAAGFSLDEPQKEYVIGSMPLYVELRKVEQPEISHENVERYTKKKSKLDKTELSCKVIGIVKDDSSELAIMGANVFLTCDSIFRAKTNKDGFFSLAVPKTLMGDQCLIRVENQGKAKEAFIPVCNPNLVELKIE